MGGVVSAGDSAIRVFDLADGDAGLDQGDVYGPLDVPRGGLDADAEMVGTASQSAPPGLAFFVDDERGCFRRAPVHSDVVLHPRRRRSGLCKLDTRQY